VLRIAGEAIGTAPCESAVAAAHQLDARGGAGERATLGRGTRSRVIHQHLSGGLTGAAIGACHHEGIGAGHAYGRVQRITGEAVGTSPSESAVAAAHE